MRRSRFLVAVWAAVFLMPRFGGAWGPVGHKTVAIIAWDRLDSTTRDKLRKILGPRVRLDQISICADIIKHNPFNCAHAFELPAMPESFGWHFIDIPTSDSPGGGSFGKYCQAGDKTDDCVVEQIREQVQTLEKADATQAQKQTALMFLVHFVGDIHQPLHCATEIDAQGRSDRGGNDKPVQFIRQSLVQGPMNLHKLWDGLVLTPDELGNADPFVLAGQLEEDLKRKDPNSWLTPDPAADAALESFKISKTVIYPSYAQNHGDIDKPYQDQMQPIVYDRLERAGVRLAYLIEQALAGN